MVYVYIYMVDIIYIYIYVDVVNGVNINQETLHFLGTTLCRKLEMLPCALTYSSLP